MKITELIAELEKTRAEYGDEVEVSSTDFEIGGGIKCVRGGKRVAFFED